jgi:hypothetical protein
MDTEKNNGLHLCVCVYLGLCIIIYIYIYIYILKVTVVGKLQLINDEYTIQMMRNIVPLSRKYKTS